MVIQDRSMALSRLSTNSFFLRANCYGEARSKRQSRHHLQKLPGGTEVEGGRRATVSVTGRLLLLDVENMKSK
jgi:hypothetical protein